jgi:hypothetical protein
VYLPSVPPLKRVFRYHDFVIFDFKFFSLICYFNIRRNQMGLPQSETNPVLVAYANAILAKDLSGRYSNPGRAMRSYQDIMAVANTGQDMLSVMMQMLQQYQGQPQVAAQNPVVQPNGNVLHTQPQAQPPAQPKGITHKDLSKRLEHFERGLLGKIESLINNKPEVPA